MTPHPDSPNPDSLPDDLHRELQAWVASPAPGEDRLAAMQTPPLPPIKPRPRRSRSFAYFAQAAAGLILFVAGFAAGNSRGTSSPQIASAPQTTASSPTPVPVKEISTPAPSQTPAAPTVPITNASSPPVQLAAEECKSPQVYQGTDGRIRINTVLCKTGSHMTWVVNPRLEVAKLSTPSSTIQEN